MNNDAANTHTKTVSKYIESECLKMNNEPKLIDQNTKEYQNYQNMRNQQRQSGKTSAEIAAELWDSWIGHPDDHEITRNVTKDNINP